MSWGTQVWQQRRCYCFHVRDYYPLGFLFPEDSINRTFGNFSHINTKLSSYNPDHKLCTQPFSLKIKNYSFHLTRTNRSKNVSKFFKSCSKFVVGLGCFVFARHYSRNVVLADFVLFSFWYWNVLLPRVCIKHLVFDYRRNGRVTPFGNLRIKGC